MAPDFKAIIRERHAIRQFRLRLVVVVIVRQMGEIRPRRADAPRGGQRLVQAHVRRMRLGPQRVEHGDFDAAHLFHAAGGTSLQSLRYASRFLPFCKNR